MRSSLLKNFSFLTVSNILMPMASMVLVVAISRLGGVEMLGAYSFLITFFFIGQTCTTAGLPIILTRDIARERRHAGSYFVSACAIGVLTVLVLSAVLLPAFAWSVQTPGVRLGLVIMAGALVPTVVQAFAESVLLAFEHAEDFVIVGLVESLLRAVVGTALVFVGYGIVAIATTFLLFRAAAAAALVIAIRRRGADLPLAVDRSRFRALLRQMPVVGVIPIVNAFYWRTDTLLLTWLRGMADVGYYGASTRLLDVTRSLPQAYARALYPVLSRLRHEEPAEFTRLSQQSLTWVVVATLPLSLIMCGLAPWIIGILFGPDMRPAILGLQIVAWVMVPYTLTNTLAQILFASGNQVLDLRVNLMSTIANVLLNLALIPRWGFIGASVAALGSMCFHVTLQYTYVRTRVHDPKVLGSFARIGGAAAVAFATITLLAARHPIIALFAGLGCYAAGLQIVGILRGEHFRWLLREGRDLARRMRAAALAFTHRRVAPKET